ncbi:hypothetical protein [Flectobacillus roseus]|uniref:Z-ring formation inhibitor MciZ n=1 Tax=Flectobacillus roseus TaxID=502259 RepID=A0ABT6YEI0_9BACT|nr:hypothetical protein [Flectobacillus roseus]MDI9861993.1 hypothetical protein [Flectobacillus roseus]
MKLNRYELMTIQDTKKVEEKLRKEGGWGQLKMILTYNLSSNLLVQN